MKNQQGAPEALEDHQVRKLAAIGAVRTSSGLVERRPIEYRRELENQFVRGFRAAEKRLAALVEAQQPATHVQNPAEIEHVAGDVSKNSAKKNMNDYAELPEPDATTVGLGAVWNRHSMRDFADATHALRARQPAPATQQAPQQPCPTCAALARTVMLDQVSFDRKPDCYGIRQITEDEGVEEWEDIRTSPDVAREEANDMMATGRGEIYEVVPLWTTPQPSPTPQADSAPLAAPADIVVLEAALRAIHQAIDLIGEPDTERLRTVRRVLRGAVVVAEDSTAPQADSQPAQFVDQNSENLSDKAACASPVIDKPAPVLDRDRIREIFMAHGFTVKEGQTDLKQYVYDAADALLRAARAPADSVTAPAGGETYHLGACIVEDMLHATVMRKEPGRAGAVTVLLSEQIPVEHLQDRDVIVDTTPPAQAADSVPKARFDDPKVQAVYAILCDDAQPPDGEHWEGFAARRIVDAISVDSVLEDAARYRWLRQEHERVDPVCHLTWKRNLQRDSSEWVNTAVLDTAIDKARKQGGA